ncbi:hypothetical protein V865_004142 [Kwoniella europaea PYCC6329]|uniref:F-box domain-containing protein n=1 Tax=Kwoniella europaea PYCC6329 TaxID=1423913 RepID=A0AAX4KI52_9TREE
MSRRPQPPQEIYSPIPRHLSLIPSLSELSISSPDADRTRGGSSSSRRYNDSSRGSRIYTATPSSTSISDISISDCEEDSGTIDDVKEAKSWLDMTGPLDKGKGKGKEEEEGLAGRLPPELLAQILRLLPDNKSLLSASLVSRSWCLCAFPMIWTRPQISSIITLASLIRVVSPPEGRTTTLPYATTIRRLHLTQLSNTLTDMLFSRLSACTRLERLTISNCVGLSSKAIIHVISHLHDLVSIDLSGITQVDDGVLEELARSCGKLQAVNLSDCRLIGDEGVRALGEGCRLLRRAKFSKCHRLTSNSLIPFVQHCTLLLELDLQDVLSITNSTVFTIFLNLPYLRELKLNNCTELDEGCIPDLIDLKYMTDEQLSILAKSIGLDQYQDQDHTARPVVEGEFQGIDIPSTTTALTLRPKMNHLDHLRVVDFTGCSNLGDKAIENLISNAPKLRTLTLTKCSNLTNESLESIEKLGKHLHYLHLGHVRLITDSGITRLAKACNRLRYIDLACCDLLTDESIMELGVNMPKLRRVGLVKVIKITDESIYALVDRYTALERIHLSYCDNLSIKAISYMLNRLPHLKHLSLTGVSSFKKKELQHFCRAPPDNFTDHQRSAFCVFSGNRVDELRRYLNEVYFVSINGGVESDSTSTRRNSGSSSTSSITVPGTSSPPFIHNHHQHQHHTNTSTNHTHGYVYRRGSAPALRSSSNIDNISAQVPGLPSMAFATPTPNFLTPPVHDSSSSRSHRSVGHGIPSRMRENHGGGGGVSMNESSREASASSTDERRSNRVRSHRERDRDRPIGPRDRSGENTSISNGAERTTTMPGGLWDRNEGGEQGNNDARRVSGSASGLGMRWFGWRGDNE